MEVHVNETVEKIEVQVNEQTENIEVEVSHKGIDIAAYSMLLQSRLNKVTITGATEQSILNLSFGSNILKPADMAIGSSYAGEIELWIKTPEFSDYLLKFDIDGTRMTKMMPQISAVDHKPMIVKFNLDFLDGVDTARRCLFSGEIHSGSKVEPLNSFSGDDILTIDASVDRPLDLIYQSTDVSQEIVVTRINLHRNR